MKPFGEWLNDFNTEDNKQEEILQELSDLGQLQGEDGFYSRSLEDMVADDDGVLNIDDTFDILTKKNVSGFESINSDMQERIDRCVQQIRDSSDNPNGGVAKLYLDEEIERIKQQAVKEYKIGLLRDAVSHGKGAFSLAMAILDDWEIINRSMVGSKVNWESYIDTELMSLTIDGDDNV